MPDPPPNFILFKPTIQGSKGVIHQSERDRVREELRNMLKAKLGEYPSYINVDIMF